jgi:hypothetical protein
MLSLGATLHKVCTPLFIASDEKSCAESITIFVVALTFAEK